MPVGNVDSIERGSGARFNDGKPDLSLIPPRWLPSSGTVQLELHLALHGLMTRGIVGYDMLYSWFHTHMKLHSHDCARVFEYGRHKYAAHNWMKGMAWSIPIACALRHADALWNRGEENDPESGLPHIGHILCNLVMVLYYIEHYPEGNDLPFSVLGTGDVRS